MVRGILATFETRLHYRFSGAHRFRNAIHCCESVAFPPFTGLVYGLGVLPAGQGNCRPNTIRDH